jgi:dTDP-glucose pyrophosphorylase
MKILVLMSGPDDSFQQAGFGFPKNLVEIGGISLAQHVIDGLKSLGCRPDDMVFTIRREEDARFHTGSVLKLLVPGAQIVLVNERVKGAACSALLAIEHFDPEEELVVTNGDIVLHGLDLAGIIESFRSQKSDGGAIVFEDVHPRWSYLRLDDKGLVVEAAEKRPISKLATAGLYYYRQSSDFFQSIMKMMRKDAHVDGKFFVCPAFNEMILAQKAIRTHTIDRKAYVSLATPHGVSQYESDLMRHS